LELQLARESAESIVRFQYGLRSDTAATRRSRVTARINVPGPIFGAKVVLGPNAARNGTDITYLPQVAIQSKGSEEWNWYLEEGLNPEILQKLGPGAGVKYLFTSQAELGRLRSRLQGFGLPATKVIRHDRIEPQTQLKARVTCQFHSNLARCVAKIAFNYLAYVLEEDTGILLRQDFDAIRNFVRYEQNLGRGFIYFSGAPRFDPEERKGSLVDGHILVVGWDAANENTCLRRELVQCNDLSDHAVP
jgi:hypothetical protein